MPKIFDKQAVFDRLVEYIDSVPDPMMQEFCSKWENPTAETMNEWAHDKELNEKIPFSETIKRLLKKQECFLVRAKDINPIMAIFRLKQPVFGYTDKQQIDANVTNKTIVVEMSGDPEED